MSLVVELFKLTDRSQDFEATLSDRGSSSSTCPTCGLVLERGVVKCPNDGTAVFEIPVAGSKIAGKYEFISTVGSGGMGVIYKARNPALNKIVAIKMMHMHLMSKETVLRFQQEGHAASQLSHTNIVAVHDLGVTEDGQPFLIMDFVDGVTLQLELKEKARLPLPRAVGIFIQVCDAIAHAHKLGVLHRDLKPSNIMLVNPGEDDESVRILDFGIAKMLDAEEKTRQALTRTGEALGSPFYMSPEQSLGKKVDQRSDLYSMGCVIYECLTGTPPFVGATVMDTMLKHLNDEPLPLGEASLGVKFPNSIESVVTKLLKKDPAERYQSMADLRHDLVKIEKGEGKALHRPDSPKKVTGEKRSLIMPIVVFLLLAVVGMGGYICYLTANTKKPCPTTVSEAKPKEAQFDRDSQSLGAAATLVYINERGKELARGIEDKNSNSIFLVDVSITDDMVERIAARKNVQVLDFTHSIISDQQLGRLSHLPLLTLRLTNTQISDRGLGVLKNMKTLTLLDVRHCKKITRAAVEAFRKAHPLCRVEVVTQVPDVGRSIRIASKLSQAGNHTAAEAELDRVVRAEKSMLIEDAEAMDIFELAGVCKWSLGKFDESEALFRKVVDLACRIPKSEGKQAKSLNFIASSQMHLGKKRAAAETYNQAIALAERAHDQKQVIDLLCGLADVLYGLNQKQDWERALHRAYEMARAVYGPGSAKEATTLFNWASAKLDLDQNEEALRLLVRDLPLYEKNMDEFGVMGVGMVKRRMAEAKLKLHKFTEAQALLDEVFKAWRGRRGINKHEWLMTHVYYGSVLSGRGQYKQAAAYFNKSALLAENYDEPSSFIEQMKASRNMCLAALAQ